MAEANNPSPSELAKQAFEEAAGKQPAPQESGAPSAQPDENLPEKYRGKSPQEIAEMHMNLEKKLGDVRLLEVSESLVERIMSENPSMSRSEAVDAMQQYLQGEAPETPKETKRSSKADRLVEYAEERQFLDAYPDKKDVLPLLRDLSSSPKYRGMTLEEIYSSPKFSVQRAFMEGKEKPNAVTAQGSQPSTTGAPRMPTPDELKGMKADDIAKLLPRVDRPY